MTPLDLKSEPYSPHGGIDGKATIRAMGKPGLEFWDLFLRETIQNSWDVRLSTTNGPVQFWVDAFTYQKETCDYLLSEVFASVPANLEPLKKALRRGRLDVLAVSDAGTRGLGGPVRADVAIPPGNPTDFVDFVRNVGRDPNKAIGGGTYGFGKAVFYQASSFGTCLIYSQTLVDGAIESRFIVMSVGDRFEGEKTRFTGRHWWGRMGDDEVLDPVIGEDARALAEIVGLDRLEPGSTGTSVAILGPNLSEDVPTLTDVVSHISGAIQTWAWPHLLSSDAGPSIEFSLTAEGEKVDLPDIELEPLLGQYARALEHADSAEHQKDYQVGWPWSLRSIDSLRPKRHLGTLVYRSVPLLEGEAAHDWRERVGHHIALLRDPRFVVKYLPVIEDPTGQAIVGVFVASAEANEAFAGTEPVAHDDWVPDQYEGEYRANPVRIALRAIAEEFRQQTVGATEVLGVDHASGTATVSRVLGSVLAGSRGSGAETKSIIRGGRGHSGGSRSQYPVSIVMDSYAELSGRDGEVIVDFGFTLELRANEDDSGYFLQGNPRIVLEGGARERNEESEGDAPEVLGWYDGEVKISSDRLLNVTGLQSGHYSLRVRQTRNTAVTAVVRLSEGLS